MTIIYDHGMIPHQEIVFAAQGEKKLLHRCFPGDYIEVFHRDADLFNDVDLFLLDESLFIFDHITHDFVTDQPLTKKQFEVIINHHILDTNKVQLIRNNPRWYTTQCFVDDRVVASPLGQQGNIHITLAYIIPISSLRDYRKRIQSHHHGTIHVPFPKHFFTMQFIQHTLRKPSFHSLYLLETTLVLVTRSNGMYNETISLNIGWGMIRDMCRDEGIDFFEAQSGGQVSKTVLTNLYTFFLDQCSGWRDNHLVLGYDCIVFGKWNTSRILMDMLHDRFKAKTGGYILPFRGSSSLDYDLSTLEEWLYDPCIAFAFYNQWLAGRFCA